MFVDYVYEVQCFFQELEVIGFVVFVVYFYGVDVVRYFVVVYFEQMVGLLLIDLVFEYDVDFLWVLDFDRVECEIEQIKRQDFEVEFFVLIVYDIWVKFFKFDFEQIGDVFLIVIVLVCWYESLVLFFFEDVVCQVWGELYEVWVGCFL